MIGEQHQSGKLWQIILVKCVLYFWEFVYHNFLTGLRKAINTVQQILRDMISPFFSQALTTLINFKIYAANIKQTPFSYFESLIKKSLWWEIIMMLSRTHTTYTQMCSDIYNKNVKPKMSRIFKLCRIASTTYCSSHEGIDEFGDLSFMLNCFSVASKACWLPEK